jgi:hypothetical protein
MANTEEAAAACAALHEKVPLTDKNPEESTT